MVNTMTVTPFAYSIAQACALSSVGRTTLYAAIGRGELRTLKVGRRRLITAEALHAWLNSCPAETSNATEVRDEC